MKKLLFVFLAWPLIAQTLNLSVSPALGPIGAAATLTVSLADPTNTIAALQFTFTSPADLTESMPVIGAAANTAGKSLQCNLSNGICIIAGINTTVIGNGVVATVPLTVASGATVGKTDALTLTGLVASTGTGSAVTLTVGTGASFTVTAPGAGPTLALSLNPTSGLPGTMVTGTLTYTDTAPSSGVAGLNWTAAFPGTLQPGASGSACTGFVVNPTVLGTPCAVVDGSASTAAQKVTSCSGATCANVGSDSAIGTSTFPLNTAPLASGPLEVITLPIPTTAAAGTLNFAVSGAAADQSGNPIALNTTPATFQVLSKYDLNSDGVVDKADVAIALGELLGHTCTAPFNLIGDGKCGIGAVILEIAAAAGQIQQ